MKALSSGLAALLVVAATSAAQAGTNDFFGSSLGSTDPSTAGAVAPPPGAAAAASTLSNSGSDYTADEKRMQKKYKSNLASAQKLIAKGEMMMKSKDDKAAKKGKIFKEIGEKRLAELKANSPFPEVAEKPGKKVD